MELPRSISDYAAALHIPITDAVVRCRFCSNVLSYCDLCNFDFKCFQLIWKDLKVFGICGSCAKASALAELSRFYVCSVPIQDLLRDGSLFDLIIRCSRCLNKLAATEKLRLVTEKKLVHKVRSGKGGWRAVCKFCIQQ